MGRLVFLCVFITTVLCARPAFAQPPEPAVTGGARAGVLISDNPNLTNAFVEAGMDVGYRYTFTFGGQVTLRLTDFLALQPEVFYAPKGLSGTDPEGLEFQ